MFTILFSNLFWITFFLVGLVSGTITFRKMANKFFKYVTEGKSVYAYSEMDETDTFITGLLMFFHYILWPIPMVMYLIVMVWDIFKVIFSKSIWVIFKNTIIKIDKLIPKFKIVKEED